MTNKFMEIQTKYPNKLGEKLPKNHVQDNKYATNGLENFYKKDGNSTKSQNNSNQIPKRDLEINQKYPNNQKEQR